MITSLFRLLQDCLPVHAAVSEALALAKSGPMFPSASYLSRFIKMQAPGEPASVPVPPIPKLTMDILGKSYGTDFLPAKDFDVNDSVKAARLWGFRKEGVNAIADGQCRARETGYRTHLVLPRVTFGLNGAPLVRAVTADGESIDLPLEERFLAAQLLVQGGTVFRGNHWMWPLEMRHDAGLVLVFVYEPTLNVSLDPKQRKSVLPLHPFRPSGRGNWKPVHLDEHMTLAGMVPPGLDSDAWLELMTGPFMKVDQIEVGGISVMTTDAARLRFVMPRIVVALSFSTFRERADFEPGGLVGMSKIFPHIMINSAVPLRSFEASVKIERSPRTTAVDAGDGTVKGTCCNAYPDVKALLVTDTNEDYSLTQLPFWGGMFSWVVPEAHKTLAGKRLKVVTNNPKRREFWDGKRYLRAFHPTAKDAMASERKDLENKLPTKEPRQGEFDNLHIAPTLKLDLRRVKRLDLPGPFEVGRGKGFLDLPVDPVRHRTDQVVMAPFCSHDCFHTHWRWGKKTSVEHNYGWDQNGPYRVAGAPMVPLYQEIELELHDASSFSYHAKSTYTEPNGFAARWDVVMHHGSAYAQAIGDWLFFTAGKFLMSTETPYAFYGPNDEELGRSHTPLFYWLLRYVLYERNGELVVEPRIDYTQEKLDYARKI